MDLSHVTQQLTNALKASGIEILSIEGKHLQLVHAYQIEIENESLFKLLHDKKVVAPFDSLNELCEFIRMDIALNYG